MTGPTDTMRWRPLGNTGVHYWLVQRMAKRCGADMVQAEDAGDLSQEDWVGLVQKCRGCTWTDGCERWLARLDEDGSVEPPVECLNADLLKALSEGRRDG